MVLGRRLLLCATLAEGKNGETHQDPLNTRTHARHTQTSHAKAWRIRHA